MCRNQTLYHNESIGYVIRCSKCDRFQIGYGSIPVLHSVFVHEDSQAFKFLQPDHKQELYFVW